MKHAISLAVLLGAALAAVLGDEASAQGAPTGIDNIETVVVIYAENRSFDNLYGLFPGADGLQNVTAANSTQIDRDGAPMPTLPAIWNGLTGKGITPPVSQAQTERLPNQPFAIDDPSGFDTSLGITTRDLWHVFYQNQMQIDGGKNDRFAAYADSGALVMGHYDGTKLPLWSVAQKYVLADNFFQGAFGGSFL
ncbi:MAG TPA: alkaline phosphatase family protein, partial [Steroidobacteraceae bacterium]|nr:alkaline phosphatase family protein [Steroidobacteraceae bacterium]